ncbi:hypothetical protein LG200_01940 [Methylobacillus caricis]|uniref:hypothetical protein n=1 Tax=Methylobacillus caricis TaxID=1971611 RepID=UPI001CFFA9BA|nr:hypothetical protein [Methylobacillus caricis]MCB5186762.1 hypothetical protein [Methylobacillus caricis]
MSGKVGAGELGLDPKSGKEPELFKWFLACYLFGHRISQEIAVNTWKVFMDSGIYSTKQISARSWQQLVDLLGQGHYKRYDESTARNMLDMAAFLQEKYHGKISQIISDAKDKKDLSDKLQEIKGVGPKVAEIFLREI